MDILIDWEDDEESSMHELGSFQDLVDWISEFNRVWSGKLKYILEQTKEPNEYLFYEYDTKKKEYSVGTIKKIGEKAHALSAAVHELVIGAFDRYMGEFGAENES
ncbi:hypothetical protein KKC94_01415 [Patescibacteria group bacterium]|nr:hypothetical protein [Patescibacteria group bacterium]